LKRVQSLYGKAEGENMSSDSGREFSSEEYEFQSRTGPRQVQGSQDLCECNSSSGSDPESDLSPPRPEVPEPELPNAAAEAKAADQHAAIGLWLLEIGFKQNYWGESVFVAKQFPPKIWFEVRRRMEALIRDGSTIRNKVGWARKVATNIWSEWQGSIGERGLPNDRPPKNPGSGQGSPQRPGGGQGSSTGAALQGSREDSLGSDVQHHGQSVGTGTAGTTVTESVRGNDGSANHGRVGETHRTRDPDDAVREWFADLREHRPGVILQAERIVTSRLGYKAVGEARSKRYDQFREMIREILMDVYKKERKQEGELASQLSDHTRDYFD
jgi:hypothetical protein